MGRWHYRWACRDCDYHDVKDFTLCPSCGQNNNRITKYAMQLRGRQWYFRNGDDTLPYGYKLSVFQGADSGTAVMVLAALVVLLIALLT